MWVRKAKSRFAFAYVKVKIPIRHSKFWGSPVHSIYVGVFNIKLYFEGRLDARSLRE